MNTAWLEALWSSLLDIFILPFYHSVSKCCTSISVRLTREWTTLSWTTFFFILSAAPDVAWSWQDSTRRIRSVSCFCCWCFALFFFITMSNQIGLASEFLSDQHTKCHNHLKGSSNPIMHCSRLAFKSASVTVNEECYNNRYRKTSTLRRLSSFSCKRFYWGSCPGYRMMVKTRQSGLKWFFSHFDHSVGYCMCHSATGVNLSNSRFTIAGL